MHVNSHAGSNCKAGTVQSKRTCEIGKTMHHILRYRIFEEKVWCTISDFEMVVEKNDFLKMSPTKLYSKVL